MITVAVCASGGTGPRAECLAALPGEVRLHNATTSWEARAQALAECETDVLALVDGDVVVPPGWLERLQAEWEEASMDVALVGGSIVNELGLGSIEYGSDAFDFDPLERTLFGGNLSFRRRALVGAGGFAPPVDGRDGLDWLSEEHEAQRQLGHWGWLGRYVPELRAERLSPERPRLVRRRWRYGVRQGLARSRPAGAAARQALTSVTGVPLALARADRRAAGDRLQRAAENAGVALGRIHPRSKERPEPPLRSRQRMADPPPLILLYHRVAAPAEDPLNLCVTPANFREQVAVLADELQIVPMAQLAAERRPGTVAITFDDGYLDNLTEALPVVAEAGASMTLFAATGRLTSGEAFEWDQGELMNPDQAREFAAHPAADLSAHTRNHPSLAGMPAEAAREEIAGSRDDAAALRGGVAPPGFAYPFGIPRQNVDEQAMHLVEEAGYEYAVVNQPIPVSEDHDRFALPRFFAPDVPGGAFREWLRTRLA